MFVPGWMWICMCVGGVDSLLTLGRGIQLLESRELRCGSAQSCGPVIHSLLQRCACLVLQQYIARPLLWRDEPHATGRKFDIRAYVLVFPQVNNARYLLKKRKSKRKREGETRKEREGSVPSGDMVTPMRAFFHPGYARICSSSYSQFSSSHASSTTTDSTLSSHITNFHIQSQSSRFDASHDTVDGETKEQKREKKQKRKGSRM